MSKKKYPVRIPNFAAGIRSQSSRTGAKRNWWSAKWLSKLEGMGIGARLGRGRSYAMSGQVTELKIAGPKVEATIVGSRKDPYKVRVDFVAPEGESRKRILEKIASEPMMVSRLAVDDMPLEIEMIFREENCHLFPGGKLAPGKYDVTTFCSCPDWANPCKHAIAVLILLGEEIERRPLTLLELRGMYLQDMLR